MSTAVVKREIVQPDHKVKDTTVDLFRWQKYVDGEGKVWIITNLWGYDRTGTRYGQNVEYLNLDTETLHDVTKQQFKEWVLSGSLRRVEGPLTV